MRPGALLQKGPYAIVKVGVGIKAVLVKIMKKKTRDKLKRVQKYLPRAHKVCHHQRNSFGLEMKAFTEFGCFARSDYAHQIYEFKILQSRRLAGINCNNDFQAYLAGSAASSQNDL